MQTYTVEQNGKVLMTFKAQNIDSARKRVIESKVVEKVGYWGPDTRVLSSGRSLGFLTVDDQGRYRWASNASNAGWMKYVDPKTGKIKDTATLGGMKVINVKW